MYDERLSEDGPTAVRGRGTGVVRVSIQRRRGPDWEVVQDGALFDGVTVMTDLTPAVTGALDSVAGDGADEDPLSVLVGPADARDRGPGDYERLGVASVTVLRTPAGEYGDALGVARLDLDRPSRHHGIACSGIDVGILMPSGGTGRPVTGVPYLERLATVLAERGGDGDDGAVTVLRAGRAASAGPDGWTVAADALASERIRIQVRHLDLVGPSGRGSGDVDPADPNLMVPRFGIGNFVCAVFACC